MSSIINVNGTLSAAEAAVVPALDHGLLFGDSVYETMRTYRGRPFLFAKHFIRLQRSAEAVFLELPWGQEKMRSETERAIQAAQNAECRIRVTVTRGVGEVGPDPDTCSHPNIVIYVTPFAPPPAAVYDRGVDVVTSSLYRSRQFAELKTGNLLRSVLAIREAKAAKAFEAILLTFEGMMSDGITSNLYMVQGSRLLTPSAEAGILPGITRSTVLDLARRAGLEVVEGLFAPSEIWRSSEMFLTSSTREIVPIVHVDGKVIGSGQPGPVTQHLLAAYRREVDILLQGD